MPLAENNIRYRAVINRNYCYRRELRKRDIWNKSGKVGHYMKKWDCSRKKTGRMGTLCQWRIKCERVNVIRWTLF
jgi:hypothetical protein